MNCLIGSGGDLLIKILRQISLRYNGIYTLCIYKRTSADWTAYNFDTGSCSTVVIM